MWISAEPDFLTRLIRWGKHSSERIGWVAGVQQYHGFIRVTMDRGAVAVYIRVSQFCFAQGIHSFGIGVLLSRKLVHEESPTYFPKQFQFHQRASEVFPRRSANFPLQTFSGYNTIPFQQQVRPFQPLLVSIGSFQTRCDQPFCGRPSAQRGIESPVLQYML